MKANGFFAALVWVAECLLVGLSTGCISHRQGHSWHTIVVEPRTNAPVVRLVDRINPLWWAGNADEPHAPQWYRPTDRHRDLKYHWRNPCHNWNCYVIGLSDRRFHRSGYFPDKIGNPEGGWNFAVSHYGICYLPFWSYNGKHHDFYFGWRERGNFGIAWRKKSAVSQN